MVSVVPPRSAGRPMTSLIAGTCQRTGVALVRFLTRCGATDATCVVRGPSAWALRVPTVTAYAVCGPVPVPGVESGVVCGVPTRVSVTVLVPMTVPTAPETAMPVGAGNRPQPEVIS